MVLERGGLSPILFSACVALMSPRVAAAQSAIHDDAIAPQALESALRAFSSNSGREVSLDARLLSGKVSRGVTGRLADDVASARLLAGSGLRMQGAPGGAMRIVDEAEPAGPAVSGPVAGVDAEGIGIQQVVVTAAKRPQRLQDVPASVVAETGADLVHRGATQLQDIVDNTPGLSNPGTGSPNLGNLTMRGVATGAGNGLKQSTVALFYDDIAVDSGAGGGAAGGTTNLRVVDIERVEVLRGPQGTLFGSGSLSGAVRYVTNKPDLKAFSGESQVTASGTRTGSASVNGSVMLNVPIVDDRLAVRAVGFEFHDSGWIDDLRAHRKDINGTDTVGARVMVASKPVQGLYTNFTVFHQDSRDHAQSDSYYSKPAASGVAGQVSDGLNEPWDVGRNTLASFYAKYDFESVSVISVTSYHDRKNISAGTDYIFLPLATAIASNFTNVVAGPDDLLFFVKNRTLTQEIRLSARRGETFNWALGAFYLDSINSTSQENQSVGAIPSIGGANLVDLVGAGTQKEFAVFAEATSTFADKFDLTAGARLSRTRLTDSVTTGGYLTVSSERRSDYTNGRFKENDHPVTPHVSIAYRATPDSNLYATAAQGFRVGGINETADVTSRAIPENYRPDRLWNYELGAKGKLLEGRLRYSSDIYCIDWSNIQVDLSNNIGNYTGNGGAARLYGIEAQTDARPTGWLSVGASISASRNRISKGVEGLSTAVGVIKTKAGDLLPASPELQIALYGEVRFSSFDDHQAYIRIGSSYIGSEYTGFDRSGTRFGNYAKFDIRSGVKIDNVDLVAFIDNVGNSQGKQSAADAASVGPLKLFGQYAYTVRPRTLGLTLRATF